MANSNAVLKTHMHSSLLPVSLTHILHFLKSEITNEHSCNRNSVHMHTAGKKNQAIPYASQQYQCWPASNPQNEGPCGHGRTQSTAPQPISRTAAALAVSQSCLMPITMKSLSCKHHTNRRVPPFHQATSNFSTNSRSSKPVTCESNSV